jgi:hypothetical protein
VLYQYIGKHFEKYRCTQNTLLEKIATRCLHHSRLLGEGNNLTCRHIFEVYEHVYNRIHGPAIPYRIASK